MSAFVNQLRRKTATDYRFADFARWIHRNYVIEQHQITALRKLPDNTFRFNWEQGSLRFLRLQNQVRFMDSRFDALATTLQDLGFCGDFSTGDQLLTGVGESFMAKDGSGTA